MRINQHSLIVLDIVGKVFYFLLAIAERFTGDDPAMCKGIVRKNQILGICVKQLRLSVTKFNSFGFDDDQ